MKTKIFILSFILFPAIVFSQKSDLDLKKIEKTAKTETYTMLLEKFKNNVTTLTLEDCRILYYGKTYRENFSGYSSPDSIEVLNKYLNEDEIDFSMVLKYTKIILEQDPLSLKYLLYAGIACKKTGDDDMAEVYFWKYTALLQAVFSSGDGKSAKTAFVVTSIPDEYSILRELDLEFTMQSLVTEKGKPYDVLSVKDSKKFHDGVYFDISLFFGKFGF